MPLRQLRALPKRLDTARLFLRPYRAEDAGWYYAMALRNHAHLERFESGNSIFDIHCEADAPKVLGDFAKQWRERTAFFLGVFLRETEEFVGQIYLGVTNPDLPVFNLGFFADYAHVNQGYVTEAARRALAFAVDDLGAHRIALWCDETNHPSRRVAEKCGFVREGHIREDKLHSDGTITGSFCYGLLRHERIVAEGPV